MNSLTEATGREQYETDHCAAAVEDGRAMWVWDRPAPRCCNDAESAPCRDCQHFPDDEPTGLLVECPRCGGLGLRQFDGFDGIVIEKCTSCTDGLVDDATARTIEELMDAADAAYDPEAWDERGRWTLADEQERAGFAREYEARVLEERIAADTASEKTLPEMLAFEIGYYRSLGTPVADLIAERIHGLLTVVNATDAKTVEEYFDRREAMLASL
jgi:hypothetical protein